MSRSKETRSECAESVAGPTSAARRNLLSKALALGTATLVPVALSRVTRAQNAGGGIATAGVAAQRGPKPGTWLVLLGTRAGPGIDITRGQTGSAVVVDGRPYLIDCGYGTLRQLVASNLGYLQVGTIFFTHLHDDHTGDVPALLSFQWTNGKTTATDAYGPYGTTKLIAACVAVIRSNVEIRTADEGRTVDANAQFHGHDVAAADTPVQVFKDDRITVTAIENTHFPARSKAKMPDRSLALRLDTKDRSIVFAGDTAYSANVAKLARGADVFVCEIADAAMLAQMEERSKTEAAAGNPNNIYRHVAETHSSPADVARMAAEANVKMVVLNHQLAGPSAGNLAYPVTAFIEGVRRGYSGEVVVGQDLMVL
ncbi:MAG TPA: MBL fold metallo-hydrolase [Steroidobacteraceae bacterium]|jgi:ribonuclease BN (tRNA processing enzyme)